MHHGGRETGSNDAPVTLRASVAKILSLSRFKARERGFDVYSTLVSSSMKRPVGFW
jgi:hypothetical protein